MMNHSTPNHRTRPQGAGEVDRRLQDRVPLHISARRARRWVGGAWRDLDALLTDISSRGVGVVLSDEVRLGDRLSLTIPMNDDGADLRVTVEIRHVRTVGRPGTWRAGGLFRNLPPADHARVLRFIRAALHL